ncbi:uncharacterized protein UV8b_03849 [Ustilaginoidea virens]|uniref:SprT-like domain-containing protein n=1 Tax=Ustilaginoidea virens TaxID=1159556 RepID=A0A063BS63_USTVR|nr:uncharacterized protein UV8b_03849 [Ustilaginoidea virens]QUC19608.1 hypothetical protein UV8b_03849 [Ustilaginoidea virens]GAO13915.1 hypothetical protein UVI_02003700 [Ustilaginoidea virens]
MPNATPTKQDRVPKLVAAHGSARRVRRLDGLGQETNTLFQPWNAQDSDGSQARSQALMKESPAKFGLLTEFEKPTLGPARSRAYRINRLLWGSGPQHSADDVEVHVSVKPEARASHVSDIQADSARFPKRKQTPSLAHDSSVKHDTTPDRSITNESSRGLSGSSHLGESDDEDVGSSSLESDRIFSSATVCAGQRSHHTQRRIEIPSRLSEEQTSMIRSPDFLDTAEMACTVPLQTSSEQTSSENVSRPVEQLHSVTEEMIRQLQDLRLEPEQTPTEFKSKARTVPSGKVPLPDTSVRTLSPPRRYPLQETRAQPNQGSCANHSSPGTQDKSNLTQVSLVPTASLTSKRASRAVSSKKAFNAEKHALAREFLSELDKTITDGRIAQLSESTGGIKLVWSKSLNTTAGRATWRREALGQTGPCGRPVAGEYQHYVSIELAEKVIDAQDKLLNVLAHEFCHLATFMLDGVTSHPHGKEFKAWASKCSEAFASRGIHVTTKHSYAIDFKYVWECVSCGSEYKRHSKSIDTRRHRCGSCKGDLKQTKPAARQGATDGGGSLKKSHYQTFVSEQVKLVKLENPGLPQRDVLRIIAEKWAASKSSSPSENRAASMERRPGNAALATKGQQLTMNYEAITPGRV